MREDHKVTIFQFQKKKNGRSSIAPILCLILIRIRYRCSKVIPYIGAVRCYPRKQPKIQDLCDFLRLKSKGLFPPSGPVNLGLHPVIRRAKTPLFSPQIYDPLIWKLITTLMGVMGLVVGFLL